MKKEYIKPETDVVASLPTVILAGSPDEGHGKSGSGTNFEDEDPDANAAKKWMGDYEDMFSDDNEW